MGMRGCRDNGAVVLPKRCQETGHIRAHTNGRLHNKPCMLASQARGRPPLTGRDTAPCSKNMCTCSHSSLETSKLGVCFFPQLKFKQV